MAYVADPYAYPENGWLFALKGNRTQEFYIYRPGYNSWQRLEDIPAPVYDGGALCFGGYHMESGLSYAYIYALVGGGSSRFFRYRFPVVPTRAPQPSAWKELSSAVMGNPVKGGGALAWCPMTGMGYSKGLVFAQRGDNTYILYKYDPVLDRSEVAASVAYDISDGGAMTTKPGGDSVWCFRGSGGRQWWVYDARGGGIRYFTSDAERTWWSYQYKGAALCHDGSFVYAEIGHSSGQIFKRFSLSGAEEQGDGGQSGTGGPQVSVFVSAGPSTHRFRIGAPFSGPVTLSVRDATGRVRASVRSTATSGATELVWNHDGVAPGVYFYAIEAAAARAAGKIVVAR